MFDLHLKFSSLNVRPYMVLPPVPWNSTIQIFWLKNSLMYIYITKYFLNTVAIWKWLFFMNFHESETISENKQFYLNKNIPNKQKAINMLRGFKEMVIFQINTSVSFMHPTIYQTHKGRMITSYHIQILNFSRKTAW